MRLLEYLTNWTLYNLRILPDRRAVPRDEPGLGERVVWSMRIGTVVVVLSAAPRLAQADPGSCSLSAADMNFGTYNAFSVGAVQSNALLTINCDRDRNIQIMIGASSVSGSYMVRQMQNTSQPDRLDYNLYADASMTDIWGPKGSTKEHAKDVGRASTIAVYGKIPAGQDVAAGEYRDVVTITIEP